MFDDKLDAVIRQLCSDFPRLSPLVVVAVARAYTPLTLTIAQAVFAARARLREALAF